MPGSFTHRDHLELDRDLFLITKKKNASGGGEWVGEHKTKTLNPSVWLGHVEGVEVGGVATFQDATHIRVGERRKEEQNTPLLRACELVAGTMSKNDKAGKKN